MRAYDTPDESHTWLTHDLTLNAWGTPATQQEENR